MGALLEVLLGYCLLIVWPVKCTVYSVYRAAYRIRSSMFTYLTDEDSDDMQSQFFQPAGNRLLTRCYKKRVLLSFVLAIELATVNI